MINILVTLNSDYINPLCSMLKTLGNSNKNECITLYVAHSSLTEEDFTKIKTAVKDFNIKILNIKLDDSLFENAPTEKRISKETYYRIFAPLYLPGSVDKILYIDPDTSIINSIKDFYDKNFDDNIIIGAKHFDGLVDEFNKIRLGITKSKHYINAGIMLLNIKEMRKDFKKDYVFKIIKKKKHILFLADQDVINILYDGKIKYENEFLINLDEKTFKKLYKKYGLQKALKWVKNNTILVHFNGKYKPWKNNYKGYLASFYEK